MAKHPITPKPWPVMEMAVEAGVAIGWNRAHKHTDAPSEEQVKNAIYDAVMTEIGEWFDFAEGT